MMTREEVYQIAFDVMNGEYQIFDYNGDHREKIDSFFEMLAEEGIGTMYLTIDSLVLFVKIHSKAPFLFDWTKNELLSLFIYVKFSMWEYRNYRGGVK